MPHLLNIMRAMSLTEGPGMPREHRCRAWHSSLWPCLHATCCSLRLAYLPKIGDAMSGLRHLYASGACPITNLGQLFKRKMGLRRGASRLQIRDGKAVGDLLLLRCKSYCTLDIWHVSDKQKAEVLAVNSAPLPVLSGNHLNFMFALTQFIDQLCNCKQGSHKVRHMANLQPAQR